MKKFLFLLLIFSYFCVCMKGETIAIGVAVLWTLSALFFEYASKRLGSVNLNLIRLVCAFFMLGITMTLINGSFIPVGADKATWFWMSLSGLVGFVLGDYFLFASYSIIMARFSQLIMTLAPPFAAIFGFILLGEKMSWIAVAGMLLTLTGISISILKKQNGTLSRRFQLQLPVKGVIFALMGALGQGVGIVLSKQGMLAYEKVYTPGNALYIPMAATQIRTIAGMISFALIILLKGDMKNIPAGLPGQEGFRFCGYGLGLWALPWGDIFPDGGTPCQHSRGVHHHGNSPHSDPVTGIPLPQTQNYLAAGGRRCIERWGSDLVFYLMNRGDAVKIINKIQ